MSDSYVGTIDQGTTSTRFILFDHQGQIVSSAQMEHPQIFPQPGWVEHDPLVILENVKTVVRQAIVKADIDPPQLKAVGITNQRETIVAWDKKTGKPYYNAIVWQDMRGKEAIDDILSRGLEHRIHCRTGLIPNPYFSASKIKWLFDHVPAFLEGAQRGDALIGTIDCWLLWNLVGGKEDSVHFTDVSNASRYLLMDIKTLEWDTELLELFGVPKSVLPKIVPSIPKFPYGSGTLSSEKGEIPLNFSGILGDQQAALFGQACFHKGQSKCTYGTGGFLLMNIGENPVISRNGLLTTVAFQVEGEPACYALEGSVAIAGSLIQWVRDNLEMIKSAPEIDQLAMTVEDCGGVYFVPAFSGLFAPYWRPSARGVICGLTGYARKAHIARAVLESTAFQVRDLFGAINQDSGIDLPFLRVDGGMTVSEPLMQIQADFLGVPVVRPKVIETTALGAAYCAGLSCLYWKDFSSLEKQWKESKRWSPLMSKEVRLQKANEWKKAIDRSQGWV